ncbi:hypothetical protein NT6N_24310 [Oceaniferula spumae]|uniref:DUF4410 domain-containing protein n=1 Tax=Oceaniferula spumae TaxID=2979115 RepID=A0AAT9FN01_9BACT
MLTLFGDVVAKEDRDESKGASTKIEGAAAKRYEEAFWSEYKKKKVDRQIYVAFGGKEPAEGEKIEVAMTMRGPHIFRRKSDQKVEAYLTLGFMGYYQVDFDASTKVKESFFVGKFGDEEARFDTFKELNQWISKQMKKLFKDKK